MYIHVLYPNWKSFMEYEKNEGTYIWNISLSDFQDLTNYMYR